MTPHRKLPDRPEAATAKLVLRAFRKYFDARGRGSLRTSQALTDGAVGSRFCLVERFLETTHFEECRDMGPSTAFCVTAGLAPGPPRGAASGYSEGFPAA